jgi:hypothetical protein
MAVAVAHESLLPDTGRCCRAFFRRFGLEKGHPQLGVNLPVDIAERECSSRYDVA